MRMFRVSASLQRRILNVPDTEMISDRGMFKELPIDQFRFSCNDRIIYNAGLSYLPVFHLIQLRYLV